MTRTKGEVLAPVIKETERFEAAQREYRGYGAQDSEPCAVFHEIMWAAAMGEPYPGQSTPEEWELFCMMKGVRKASTKLTAVARMAHEAVSELLADPSYAQAAIIVDYLEDYCWRVVGY